MPEVSDVVLAYKIMLGREPESLDAISHHLQAPDVATMRKLFALSEEFQQTNGTFWVGQHLDEECCSVDVAASPEQLASMFERTARDWRGLGTTEPFWSVITSPDFLNTSIETNKNAFYETGVGDVNLIQALLRRNGFNFPKGTVLDFGCGVGRLSLALAPHVDQVIGVDVSEAHLRLARERQKGSAIGNARFQSISGVGDIEALPRVDLLVSLIVLQHNAPPVMKAMLGSLLSLVSPGGLAVFQLPVFKAGYAFAAETYLNAQSDGGMEMHVLPQREVHAVLRDNSMNVIEVREDTMAWNARTVSQTFLVQRI